MSGERHPSRTTSFEVDPLRIELTSVDPPTSPPTRDRVLDQTPDGRIVRGIWEIDPGTTEDVEEDELFVVLIGSATVELRSGERLVLRPGTAGILRRGERTRWIVHETLRKVYQISLDAEPVVCDEEDA